MVALAREPLPSPCCRMGAYAADMARIMRFTPITKDRVSRHSEVECGYSFVTYEGEPAILLETYGSTDRAIPGKTSQSLLLDRTGARDLLAILRKL
jgi:hypothetical protein